MVTVYSLLGTVTWYEPSISTVVKRTYYVPWGELTLPVSTW